MEYTHYPTALSMYNSLYLHLSTPYGMGKTTDLYIDTIYGKPNLEIPKGLKHYDELIAEGYTEPDARELLRLFGKEIK